MNRLQIGTITVWVYKSAVDNLATIITSAYFDPHAPLLNNGDIIFIADTNVPTIDMATVTSVSKATPVTVLNGT